MSASALGKNSPPPSPDLSSHPLPRTPSPSRASSHEEDLLFSNPPPTASESTPSRYSLNLCARVHSFFCCLNSSSKEVEQKLPLGKGKESINNNDEAIDCGLDLDLSDESLHSETESDYDDDFPDSCGAALGSFACAIGSASKTVAGCAWSGTKTIANAGLTAGSYAWSGTKKTTGAVARFFDNRIVSGSLVFVSATGLATSVYVEYQPGIYTSSATFGYALQSYLGPKLFGSRNKVPSDPPSEAEHSDSDNSFGSDNEMHPKAPDSPREGEVLEPVMLGEADEETALVKKAKPKESRFVRVMDGIVNHCAVVHKTAQKIYGFILPTYSYELHGTAGFLAGFSPSTLPPALDMACGLFGIYSRNQLRHVIKYVEKEDIEPTSSTQNTLPSSQTSFFQKLKNLIKNNWPTLFVTGCAGTTYIITTIFPCNDSSIVSSTNKLSLIILTRPLGYMIAHFCDHQFQSIKKNAYTGVIAKVITAAAVFWEFQSVIVTGGYIIWQLGYPLIGLSMVGLAHGAKDYRQEDAHQISSQTLAYIGPNHSDYQNNQSPELNSKKSCCRTSLIKAHALIIGTKLYCKEHPKLLLEITHTIGLTGLGVWQVFVPGGGYYGSIIIGVLLANYFTRKLSRHTSNKYSDLRGKVSKHYLDITDKYQFDFVSLITFFRYQNQIMPVLLLSGITWGTFREQVSLYDKGNYSFDQNSMLIGQLVKEF